jgi:hypothetical protein
MIADTRPDVHDRTPMGRPAHLKVCGDCTLCCTVFELEDFEKKAGQDCHHSRADQQSLGGSCSIWGLHPQTCQTFKCLWLKHDDLDGLWRPDASGFVMTSEGSTVYIDVDPVRPDAFLREPYYSQFKQWAEVMPKGEGPNTEGRIIVRHQDRLCVITPDEDLHIRAPKRNERLETGMEWSLFGLRPYARIVPARPQSLSVRRRA